MLKKYLAIVLILAALCGVMVFVYATRKESQNQMENSEETETQTQYPSKVKSGYGKVLVAYFSVPETDGVDTSSGASRVNVDGRVMGNTEYVASIISSETGADLFEIKTSYEYPGTHQALIDAAKKEADSNARPKLVTHVEDMEKYDVVFVGFPNWWYDMPMPIYSFFDEYEFKGKTIIPFCTHGGSRFSDAIKTIREKEKQATVLDGYAVARERVEGAEAGVSRWLKQIGMKISK